MTYTEKRFIEIENQSSGECEELEYGDEYIESKVISLTRKIHPQDLGEETSKLENILRQALEEVLAEERVRVRGEIEKNFEKMYLNSFNIDDLKANLLSSLNLTNKDI